MKSPLKYLLIAAVVSLASCNSGTEANEGALKFSMLRNPNQNIL